MNPRFWRVCTTVTFRKLLPPIESSDFTLPPPQFPRDCRALSPFAGSPFPGLSLPPPPSLWPLHPFFSSENKSGGLATTLFESPASSERRLQVSPLVRVGRVSPRVSFVLPKYQALSTPWLRSFTARACARPAADGCLRLPLLFSSFLLELGRPDSYSPIRPRYSNLVVICFLLRLLAIRLVSTLRGSDSPLFSPCSSLMRDMS